MEHSCQLCHSAVTDSSAFCPSCGAPQVQFARPEPSAIPIVVAAGVAPPIARVETSYSIQQEPAASNRRAAFRAAVNAGTIAAILSLIPGLAVLALPLAGFLCVLLYRRYSPAGEPTPGLGFRLGARAGLSGSLIFIVLQAILILAAHTDLRTAAIEAVQRAGSLYSDQQVREAVEYLKTPEGLTGFVILGSVVVCVLFVLLSGVGGAVSAALLRRKVPPS